MLDRPALDRVEARHRLGVRRVGAQAVNRFRRKSHEPAGAENLRGLADLAAHGLGSSAFLTASVCRILNCASLVSSPLSDSASTAIANNEAFAAPASPIASVATGMPFGICTVDKRESSPCRCLEGIGTPSTGSVVCAATTPARCAAPPAAAMITFNPFL